MDDPAVAAQSVFDATARFHDPAYAAEWPRHHGRVHHRVGPAAARPARVTAPRMTGVGVGGPLRRSGRPSPGGPRRDVPRP
ncbi:hypothetical protein [Streptomyces sp. BE133]|uniref:hypothetical protein n=1 Tax=Streptomyces sp. BE133 TaxID=3002523 RepID=UPI002E7A8AA1|nr:hypothetical protein [Streptomyces sp. BE133]